MRTLHRYATLAILASGVIASPALCQKRPDGPAPNLFAKFGVSREEWPAEEKTAQRPGVVTSGLVTAATATKQFGTVIFDKDSPVAAPSSDCIGGLQVPAAPYPIPVWPQYVTVFSETFRTGHASTVLHWAFSGQANIYKNAAPDGIYIRCTVTQGAVSLACPGTGFEPALLTNVNVPDQLGLYPGIVSMVTQQGTVTGLTENADTTLTLELTTGNAVASNRNVFCYSTLTAQF